MSDKFKNFTFVLAILLCFVAAGATSYSTITTSQIVNDTFNSLTAQAEHAYEISLAQEYALGIGQMAAYEASRAYELDQKLQLAKQQVEQVSNDFNELQSLSILDAMSIRVQTEYIEQLIEILKENNLQVPEPDLSRLKDNEPDFNTIDIEIPTEEFDNNND